MNRATEVAKILVDAYEFVGFDTSKLTVYDMLFGLIFDGDENGQEAYDAILRVLRDEVIDRIKAGG